MSLLRSLLIDKELFEVKEDVDAFLEENNIEPGFIIQKIEFDKTKYADKQQVNDFAEAHYLYDSEIEEEGGAYSLILFNHLGFVKDSMRSLDLRDGVKIVVGLLRPMSDSNPLLFKDADNKSVKFTAEHPYIIEVARVVNGFHVAYGEVKITKNDLKSFKSNFDNNTVGVDLSIDFDHETREAAGWIKELFLSEDGEVLMAGVKWTPKGALSLSDREFRYFSPEFSHNYIHPHTGKQHGPTLLGGGLVNRPFLKMGAIVSMKNVNKQEDFVETISLSDHKTKVSELEKSITELKLSEATATNTISGLKAENVKLSEELKDIKVRAEKEKKEAEINLLFSENKINKAQRDALLEGKDMMEVFKLSASMNPAPKGSADADNKDQLIQLSESELALCEKFELTPEEYVKFNKGAQ